MSSQVFSCVAGDLWAWGRNAAGQLGIGGSGKSDMRTPLRVEPLRGAPSLHITTPL
jgi:alpha-tubulin suppressor-like RCC1 family protein